MPRRPPAYVKESKAQPAKKPSGTAKPKKKTAKTKPAKKPAAATDITEVALRLHRLSEAVQSLTVKQTVDESGTRGDADGGVSAAPAAASAVQAFPVVVRTSLVWPDSASGPEDAAPGSLYVIKFTADKTAVVVSSVTEGPLI